MYCLLQHSAAEEILKCNIIKEIAPFKSQVTKNESLQNCSELQTSTWNNLKRGW